MHRNDLVELAQEALDRFGPITQEEACAFAEAVQDTEPIAEALNTFMHLFENGWPVPGRETWEMPLLPLRAALLKGHAALHPPDKISQDSTE